MALGLDAFNLHRLGTFDTRYEGCQSALVIIHWRHNLKLPFLLSPPISATVCDQHSGHPLSSVGTTFFGANALSINHSTCIGIIEADPADCVSIGPVGVFFILDNSSLPNGFIEKSALRSSEMKMVSRGNFPHSSSYYRQVCERAADVQFLDDVRHPLPEVCDADGSESRHCEHPRVPISSYEHTSTAQRTSGNLCFGATIGGICRW